MSEWRTEGESLVRDYKVADFAAALEFVNAVGELAEEADHHPDILVHGRNKVRLTIFTHTQDAITDADRAMADTIDGIA